MNGDLFKQIAKLNREYKKRSRLRLGLLALSFVVVLSTLSGLLLPAFTMEKDVYCGLEEHVHTDACYEKTPMCGMDEDPEHVHGDDCFETVLSCGKQEHEHGLSCGSDPMAAENEEEWKASFPEGLDRMSPAERLTAIAVSQLGYSESTVNYTVEDDGSVSGYTRYGDWYGDRYAEWNSIFISFCLYYAGIMPDEIPYGMTCGAVTEELSARRMLLPMGAATLRPGDLVFLDSTGDGIADRAAVVLKNDGTGVIDIIEGDSAGTVRQGSFPVGSPEAVGCCILPEVLRQLPEACGIQAGAQSDMAPEQDPAQEEVQGGDPGSEAGERADGAGIPAENTEYRPARSFRSRVGEMYIMVDAPEGAFPTDAVMYTEEIPEDSVLSAVTVLADGKQLRAQAVDISFISDGREIEPELPVRVSIRSSAIAESDESMVVHFDNEGAATLVELAVAGDNAAGEVAFDTESFSVYAVLYTVDFHYEVDGKLYEYTLRGGAAIGLKELLCALGAVEDDPLTAEDEAQSFMDSIVRVEFSDPELLSVSRLESDATVGEIKEALGLVCETSAEMTDRELEQVDSMLLHTGDWAIISLKAFSTDEVLTVTMKHGEIFAIRVTDYQENPYGLGGKSFSIVAENNGTRYYLGNSTGSGSLNAVQIQNNTAAATEWFFEYMGNGKYFLVHDASGKYLIITPDGLSLTDDVNVAKANPIVVDSQNNKVSLRSRDATPYALRFYHTTGWNPTVNFRSSQYNESGSDFWFYLQEPDNVQMPGEIATADTSGKLTINIYDYGPESSLDDVSNHFDNTSYFGPAYYTGGLNTHQLKFFSWGDGGSGINYWTGGIAPRQGIVNDLLSGGYPTLNTANSDVSTAESLNYLFGGVTDSNVTPYTGLNHLFTKDDKGYYRYSSDENYAYLNGSNFKVYSTTFQEEGADGNNYYAIGFFPFNDYNSRYVCVHGRNFNWCSNSSLQGHYNHHFGMTMSGEFIYPPDGKNRGEDIIFHFSGDDDMWVYIDEVLALDIGGIHNATDGLINITTGQVWINNEEQFYNGMSGPYLRTKYKALTGNDWDSSDYSSHEIKMFYMERGGMYSNLSLEFNLPLYETVTVSKELVGLTDTERAKYSGEEFGFDLEIKDKGASGFSPFSQNAAFHAANGTVTETTVVGGAFRLKDGEKLTALYLDLDSHVFAEETDLDTDRFEVPQGYRVYYDDNGEKHAEQIALTQDGSGWKTSEYDVIFTDELVFTNTLKEKNLDVVKSWSDGNANHESDPIQFTLKAYVDNGGVVTTYESAYPSTPTITAVVTQETGGAVIRAEENVIGGPYALNADNGWSISFDHLPAVAHDGKTITYAVEEIYVRPGYTSTVTPGSAEKINLDVYKFFLDDAVHSETIPVYLRKGAQYYDGSGWVDSKDEALVYILEGSNDYHLLFEDLPEGEYSVESDTPGHTEGLTVFERPITKMTILNSPIPSLPNTGGHGRMIFYIGAGAMFLTAAALMAVRRRRRSML